MPKINEPLSCSSDILPEFLAFNRFLLRPNLQKTWHFAGTPFGTPFGSTKAQHFLYTLGLQVKDLVIQLPNNSFRLKSRGELSLPLGRNLPALTNAQQSILFTISQCIPQSWFAAISRPSPQLFLAQQLITEPGFHFSEPLTAYHPTSYEEPYLFCDVVFFNAATRGYESKGGFSFKHKLPLSLAIPIILNDKSELQCVTGLPSSIMHRLNGSPEIKSKDIFKSLTTKTLVPFSFQRSGCPNITSILSG
jgi:hypothetical protein